MDKPKRPSNNFRNVFLCILYFSPLLTLCVLFEHLYFSLFNSISSTFYHTPFFHYFLTRRKNIFLVDVYSLIHHVQTF